MTRIWEEWLTEKIPDKKRIWAILSALFDVALIGGIVALMFFRSCEICYTTAGIQGYEKHCTAVTDIYANGHPLAEKILGTSYDIEPTTNISYVGESNNLNWTSFG